ncbi:MAG: rhomboid family intramembrane serine protease [Candidatus Azobacteroides sp.]|nr:rhomboid family intramembrane serine protease [Candidatus Azobacteroides sp.]
MNPSILLLIVTVAVSIWAFQSVDVINRLILSPYLVVHRKQWYRVVTHAFIHANWMHLLFNMLALWSFGVVVIRYFGFLSDIPDIHFYIMYFAAIVLASLPDLIKRKNDFSYRSLGASGAVSAVIFSAIFFDPWSTILIFFIPCPGIVFGVLYLIYSNYMSKKGGDNINHDAHFYGAVFGFVYPLLMAPESISVFTERLLHPRFF